MNSIAPSQRDVQHPIFHFFLSIFLENIVCFTQSSRNCDSDLLAQPTSGQAKTVIDDSIVTQFLIPSGTSNGGDETTFEYVQVDLITVESLGSTANVAQTSLTTLTGELVASASGFALDATFTAAFLGVGIPVTVTEGIQCQATASDSGECSFDFFETTGTTTGVPITQLIAVSSPTATSSSTSGSFDTSASVSPTSDSSKNGRAQTRIRPLGKYWEGL
ncbi:hypothetical protein BT96DRAFT_94489 [Gymnopus androsaceus JB14]|uniref:Uncharacterized protein n=1 Tax=Gymnopus androsaceus JB14 TaxID=1447944 RepID=A0A6A4HG96_9AGAR|nr:hypothetical protein BT96DRAFT_94489 [Gymnopus androsaceus JB14]